VITARLRLLAVLVGVTAVAGVALLAVPVVASAAGSTAVARAQASLYLGGAFTVDHGPVSVPGRAVSVTGVVRPYVPGQRVRLRAFLNGRRFESVLLRLKPSARAVYGGFHWTLHSPGVGQVSVVVTHSRTAQLNGFERRTGFAALSPTASFGQVGRFVQLVQQRLAALHFYIPQTGVYDAHTGLAIDAYHRLLGWGASQLLDRATIAELLNGRGSFHVRFPKQGDHAEGNLGKQLLALIKGRHVYWILPISSGKPSTPTVLGSWRVYQRTPGLLPDGMYYSSFFTGGYAIHGYDPAPDYPASHGCMRLPMIDAIPVYDWLRLGDWVDTYY
jgi:hypothetical protein